MIFGSGTQRRVATVTGGTGGCAPRVVSLCLLLLDIVGEVAESLMEQCKRFEFVPSSYGFIPIPPFAARAAFVLEIQRSLLWKVG